jgi:hypothetical protein
MLVWTVFKFVIHPRNTQPNDLASGSSFFCQSGRSSNAAATPAWRGLAEGEAREYRPRRGAEKAEKAMGVMGWAVSLGYRTSAPYLT